MEAERLVLNLEIERAKNDNKLRKNVNNIKHVALNEGDGWDMILNLFILMKLQIRLNHCILKLSQQ